MYQANSLLGLGQSPDIVYVQVTDPVDLSRYVFDGSMATPRHAIDGGGLIAHAMPPKTALTSSVGGAWILVPTGRIVNGINEVRYWQWTDPTGDIVRTVNSPGEVAAIIAQGGTVATPGKLATVFSSPFVWLGLLGVFYLITGKGKK